MRICLFSHFFLPRVGGIENASRVLADGWTQLGHQVQIVTETAADGFDDSILPYPVIRHPDANRWRAVLGQSDVVISNGFSLRNVMRWRRRGIPYGWIHGMILGGNWDFPNAVKFQLRRFATHLGHYNICVSKSMKQHIWNRRAVVIYNAIDPMFRRMPEVAKTGRLLFFGRLWEPKGLHILLQAVAGARAKGTDLPLDIVGEGEELEPSRKRVAELGIGDLVRFFPFQKGETLMRTINAANMVVVPSVWEEPFGLTAAEAMACGTCVVGTRAGGLAEVLEGAGVSFRMGDSAELTDLLIALLRDPEKVRALERAGLERAAAYHYMRICRQYAEFLQHVVARHKRAD